MFFYHHYKTSNLHHNTVKHTYQQFCFWLAVCSTKHDMICSFLPLKELKCGALKLWDGVFLSQDKAATFKDVCWPSLLMLLKCHLSLGRESRGNSAAKRQYWALSLKGKDCCNTRYSICYWFNYSLENRFLWVRDQGQPGYLMTFVNNLDESSLQSSKWIGNSLQFSYLFVRVKVFQRFKMIRMWLRLQLFCEFFSSLLWKDCLVHDCSHCTTCYLKSPKNKRHLYIYD